jgi:hypothetical protein
MREAAQQTSPPLSANKLLSRNLRMSNAYERGYDDCMKHNGDDADEFCPFDVDSPQYQDYMFGWSDGEDELWGDEECDTYSDYDNCEDYDYDDSMDGDFDSGMESCGHGMDEDYDHYDGGEDW